MPEIDLGIGRSDLPLDPLGREVLTWFNHQGDRYLTTEEQLNLERQRADIAQQQLESLLAQMRSLGIQPEEEI
jgi:hypothetical protein